VMYNGSNVFEVEDVDHIELEFESVSQILFYSCTE